MIETTQRREDGTDPIYLRYLEIEDLERVYKWHNDRHLYELLVRPFQGVSHATVEKWLTTKQAYSSQEVNLAICLTENDCHIGNIYLRDIDWIARHAELSTFIGEATHRSKGYGQIAVRLLIKHAFQDLGLQRLYLVVLQDNQPAIRVYEKCGFVVEGTLRRHVFKNGQFNDVLFMGICASDMATGDA
jgi:RimJ/RimL family protein N-acetyltransferase